MTVFHHNVRSVNDLMPGNLATAIVDNCKRTVAIHRNALALATLHRLQLDILDCAILASLVLRRLLQARRTTNVERTHCELRARLTD